jgi:hypothetical protein
MAEKLGNNYPNPLDNFRSYSYHFILTVAPSSEVVRQLVGDKEGLQSPLFAAVEKAGLGDKVSIKNSEAYLLVDSRRFSQYSITAVEMDHVYGTGSRVNPTKPIGALTMKLTDTTGLSFFNLLMDVMRNRIKSSQISAFFLLTILFVGHDDDGNTRTVSTCFIPLTLATMGFEFTSSGSLFDLQFFETEGGPQNGSVVQQVDYLGKINSISTMKKENTLGGALQVLEDQLNIQSLEFYQKFYNDKLKKSGSSSNNELKLGKLVQYMITIPDKWKNFRITTASRSKNKEGMFKSSKPLPTTKENVKSDVTVSQTNQENRYFQFTFSQTTTITDAIKSILESSKEFLELASEDLRKQGRAIAAKTVTSFTSDNSTFTIHFDIYEHMIPKIDEKTGTLTSGNPSRATIGSEVKNLITYDYIFTGKNSHIKDLKIQYHPAAAVAALSVDLEIGQARFADNAAAGQKKSDVSNIVIGAPKTRDLAPQIGENDPILLPMISKDQAQNNTAQKNEEYGKEESTSILRAKQEYTNTYASLHFLSSIGMEMTVRGNPNLIRKYADRDERGGVPPHQTIISTTDLNSLVGQSQLTAETNFNSRVKQGVADSKRYYIEKFITPRINPSQRNTGSKDELLNGIDIATMPVFVKINILAPNVDFTGEYKSGEPLFTDKFFFNGPYRLLTLKTIFSGGEFDHIMTLIPHDISGSYTASGEAPVVNRGRGDR